MSDSTAAAALDVEVPLPRLSDAMEDGVVLSWLAADGDVVAAGAPLVEIETDKATMTCEAPAAGVLEIIAREGETVPVGTSIAILRVQGGHRHDASPSNGAVAAGPARPGRPERRPRDAAESPGRRAASPLARRLARELGVPLSEVVGSGPRGRIVKADVIAVHASGQSHRQADPEASPRRPGRASAAAKGDPEIQELSRLQRTVARRMAESKANVPEFTISCEVDMEEVLALRGSLRQAVVGEEPVPSLNDLIVKACGLALRSFPRVNGSFHGERFELHERVNVGVAVAGADALCVPVVRDVDERGIIEIAAETRRLAARVRAGEIEPSEMNGATFTVSNLGMYGVRRFTAVIDPPQAAILAVGALAPRPAVREGALVVRHLVDLDLTCDHRILYGADAAQFLGRVRELLEQPLRLLLR